MTAATLSYMIGGGLFAAFLIGWIGHWGWSRIARIRTPEAARVEDLAAELLHAVAERDSILEEKLTTESSLSRNLDDRAAEMEARVAEIESRLREREAELAAAMEGLGDARREIAGLRGED